MNIIVHAKPGSGKSKIEKMEKGRYKAWVKEPAKDNKANFALLSLLSEHFQVSESNIRLLGGRTSSKKVFEIKNEKS